MRCSDNRAAEPIFTVSPGIMTSSSEKFKRKHICEVYWCMISTGTHDSNCVLSPLCLCWHHSLIQVIISLLYLSSEVASIQLHGLKKELILKKEDNKIHWKHSILLLTCQAALNSCLVLWIMRQIYCPLYLQ